MRRCQDAWIYSKVCLCYGRFLLICFTGKCQVETIMLLPVQQRIMSLIVRVMSLMSVIWAVNDFFYIAGTLNAENLAGNIFLNFSLLSLTELPSVFIGQFLIDRYGRRWTHACFMMLSTVPMILCVILVETQDTAVVILTLISKVTIILYRVVYIIFARLLVT